MNTEMELRMQLLKGILPNTTRVQKQVIRLVNEMIKLILPFLNHQPFQSMPDVSHLRDMLRLYENWRTFTESYKEIDRHFEEMIVAYLLKISHYWWVDDDLLLNTVISYYIECYPNLQEILYGVIDERPMWKSLFKLGKWLQPNRVQNRIDNSPLAYCLSHYDFDQIMIFERHFIHFPRRYIDSWINSPPEDCFYKARPEKLLILLQHGISISGTSEKETEAHCYLSLLDEMLFSLSMCDGYTPTSVKNFLLYVRIPMLERGSVVLCGEYRKRKTECGRIAMRIKPQLLVFRELKSQCEDIIKQATSLNATSYFPCIKQLSEICPLKHLSRVAIRVQLKCKNNLPNGIDMLNLPRFLKNYLNLLED